MKTSKKVISLVLTVAMILTTFAIAAPVFVVDANAITTSDGTGETVTQTQIVTDTSVYDTYAANYLNGAGFSTGIVIPGLDPAQDYVIQGMTYYPARDWMLVTAYHNDATASSKIFALDAATGDFVAMFSFLNVDGTTNMDHGGGIAISENNIYYSCGDKDRKIAYAPLSALENAPVGQHTVIQLAAEAEFVEIGSVSSDDKTAYTAYVCYDEGILWMGNFYDLGAKLLGVTIAAADYNAPSNDTYNSMVFGYKLSGNDSATEWANLVGGVTDCKGNPSYAIGLSNTLKDVQYATVDNGKLYLSRSYGSGSGNSVNFGFGETSFLTVADIDLSVPGTVPVQIATSATGTLDRTVMAYDISDYKDFPMMPMSEGLCVINDNIFITFEGASNKYLNESDGLTSIGNCEKPVDVIWQLDPYALMEVEIPEPEKSIYYEKVYDMSEIENGKEYLIVYESNEKDPVTQEQILYAFNADGNFKDYRLSKSTASTVKGYNGMIGHAISDYDLIDLDEDGTIDTLYLNDPEKDDIENIRWTLNNVSDANYRITSTESYFANCNNLYFDADQITMAPGNAGFLSEVQIAQLFPGNGDFYLSNNGAYFLWCNDGTKDDYNSKINMYYVNNTSANPIYSGITEQKGTFHCDAINMSGANAIGGSVPVDDGHYYEGAFHIYKRIVDEVASTYESRVYTNLGAELQEDGTYTVELETYAISPNHYQHRGVMPTDYIVVADTSNSMTNAGSTGIAEFNGSLAVSSLSVEANTSDDNGTGVSGYGFTNPGEDIYLKHTDGKYYRVYMAVNTTELKKIVGIISTMRQKYYAYYIADDGLYYCIEDHAVNPVGRSYEEFKAWVDSGENESDYSTKTSNSNRRKEDVYTGLHYRFDDVSSSFTDEHTRIDTLKNAASTLVAGLANENPDNRVAFVQFGADTSTGFCNTSGTLKTDDYANAFFDSSNIGTLQTYIGNIAATTQTNNTGIEFQYVNSIMANSGIDYTGADSTRNVAVIFLSDGVPGADGESGNTTAANAVISKALDAKKAGAFVYTVMIGADSTSFNRNLYMEAVSSKYAEATSMTSTGGQSVDGVTYALSLATITINNFVNFSDFTLEQTSINNGVGLENLDANAYLREKLSEAFKFPEDKDHYRVKVELVPGVFDKIGRFNFDEDAAVEQTNGADGNVSWVVDEENRSVTVTDYDYSKQYIGKNRTTPGNKLRITITGLLANEIAKIQNTSINDVDATGIYKTDGTAFKYLPTEYFNIPEYTYVLDYGFEMYDYDVNGTLKSVSADLSRQRDADGNLDYKTLSENGLVEITNSNLDLIYKTTPTNFADSGYCLIQRDDGTYDWFEIKVVPASNVLFEEDADKKYTTESTNGVAWGLDGSPLNNRQALTNNETDVYGNDPAYVTTDHNHSNGSALVATVNATDKRSTTKSFQFIGKGFDLISACGPNTGIMTVSVKDKDGKLVKGYIVDTYYSADESNVNLVNGNGLVCQTPIVSYSGEYGTYTVETTAVYLSSAHALNKSIVGTNANGKLAATTGVPVNEAEVAAMLEEVGMSELAAADLEIVWFDDNSIFNGGSGAAGQANTRGARADGNATTSLVNYIDGYRIYHPMNGDDSGYIDSEKGATYHNVINNLTENGSLNSSTDASSGFAGLAYVETDFTADEETGEKPTLSFATYEQIGPQNEFYLKGNGTEALIFKVALNSPDSKVQLGLRAVTGTATFVVGSGDKATTTTISGPTEMYYDITDCIDTESGIATVTIQNTGSTVLAVNNIKVTGEAATAIIEEEDLANAAMFMMEEPTQAEVVNGVVTPVEDETDTETDTDTDAGTDSGSTSSPLSFIEQIIAMIMAIFESIFKMSPLGEVK